MASTKASNDRTAVRYTDTDGNNWVMSGKSVYVADATDGPKLGVVLADGTEVGALPRNFRPRRAQFNTATGESRWVVCYTAACAAFTDRTTALTLDLRGVDTAFTRGKLTRGERANYTIKPGS